MSTVVPKLIYSTTKFEDVPVWEITTPNGKIYYERVRHKGLRPIGLIESYKLGQSTINVCELVKPVGNRMPKIFRVKDGYVAPMSWYERDPLYDGPIDDIHHQPEEDIEDYGDAYANDSYSDDDH